MTGSQPIHSYALRAYGRISQIRTISWRINIFSVNDLDFVQLANIVGAGSSSFAGDSFSFAANDNYPVSDDRRAA